MMVSYSMCVAVEARRILTWQLGKGSDLGALERGMASEYYCHGPGLR
jgi:hypothetical protein